MACMQTGSGGEEVSRQEVPGNPGMSLRGGVRTSGGQPIVKETPAQYDRRLDWNRFTARTKGGGTPPAGGGVSGSQLTTDGGGGKWGTIATQRRKKAGKVRHGMDDDPMFPPARIMNIEFLI